MIINTLVHVYPSPLRRRLIRPYPTHLLQLEADMRTILFYSAQWFPEDKNNSPIILSVSMP
jgi:hypothetical protein